MYKCLNCGNEFEESESIIIEYGTGAVLSKIQLFGCPECECTKLIDTDDGSTQDVI